MSSSFWHDAKVRSWTDDGRTLALYVMTCPACSGEGFFHLSLLMAADDLGWSAERLQVALDELVACDFLDWDASARLAFIVKRLKHHPPIKGAPSIKGALNVLDEAKGSPRLFARFLAAADRYQHGFASAIREHYGLPEGPYEAPSRV